MLVCPHEILQNQPLGIEGMKVQNNSRRHSRRLLRVAASSNNPLHGVTLEQLLNELVSFYGWDALGRKIEIRCFTHDPSIASSLKFLRRTPWARERVESLYIEMAQGIGDRQLYVPGSSPAVC